MVRSLFFLSLCLVHAIFALSCGSSKNKGGSDPAPEADPAITGTNIRVPAGALYPSVGEIKQNGLHLCSGVILSHGLFATAKHCFREYAGAAHNADYALYFSTSGTIDADALTVKGSSITAIDADDANDDIAYIHYNKSDTAGHITIDCSQTAKAAPTAGQSVHLVGYPTPNDAVMRRLISEGCSVTGKSGTLPPMDEDPGYSGLLYDTNCGAWYGNSGGPVFAVDAAGHPTELLGVVTHTFDLLPSGNLDTSKVVKDTYGSHVSTTNISSFSLAKKLPNGFTDED